MSGKPGPLTPSSDYGEPAPPPPGAKSKVWITFQDQQGTRWRVFDHAKVVGHYEPVPLGAHRATHRGFVVVGKHPQAYRYAFTGEEDEHELGAQRLGQQLYLARRVKPPRRDH